jgi:hypothetical protein
VKLRRAYVQAQGGVPSDEAFFKASEGFRRRGVPCERFDPPQLHQRALPPNRRSHRTQPTTCVEDLPQGFVAHIHGVVPQSPLPQAFQFKDKQAVYLPTLDLAVSRWLR